MGSTALSRRAVYLGSVLVFAWQYMAAGSQCTPAALRAACHGLSVDSHLAGDPDDLVTISMCPLRSGFSHTGWSLSPDGSSGSAYALDTSLPKYTIDGRRLTISNINGTDEGLYRCTYGTDGTERIACIYVYGRAVFASCPPGSCANNPTSLSVEDGGSVSFDATVIHTPGGSCDFRQEIDTVQLTRLEPAFGVKDDQLLSCATSEVSCGNSNASLSRGNDPGYEFVFTLNNASLERDNRRFRVSVHLIHPATGSTEQIEKDFVLQVTPRPPSSTGTPETDSPSMDTTATDTEPGVATDTVEQRRSSQMIIIGVLVPVVLIIMLIAVVLAIIIIAIWRRSRTQDDLLVNEKAPESHIIAQEVNADYGRGEKVLSSNPTNLDCTQEVTPQAEQPPPYYATVRTEQPRKSIELNRINNEEPKPTEPSFYDNRDSLIESDFHLPTDTNLNSRPQLVTICEGHGVETEQTGNI